MQEHAELLDLKMLQNQSLIAKIGFGTTGNEPFKLSKIVTCMTVTISFEITIAPHLQSGEGPISPFSYSFPQKSLATPAERSKNFLFYDHSRGSGSNVEMDFAA